MAHRPRRHVAWLDRSAPWMPAVLLPSQLRPRRPLTASRRLLAAVLAQALDDLRLVAVPDRHGRLTCPRGAAISWIEAEPPAPDAHGRFSFREVCEGLGLDPDAARAALRRTRYRPHLVLHLEVSDRRHRPPLA